ncbi:hypothetical protein [Bacillus massilinigeriensis]|uniref:hypothetical protein n=1 Tax=Bacillus mediterraneensis TaxID=1805474 RepID=UPI0008F90B43|nr:hypothetical protein [Bacillus mediterraneensis]
MKKVLWIFVLLLAITSIGGYFFLKNNPPLEVSILIISDNRKSVVVGVGNNGFREVKILDVSVNNQEKPLKTRIQVSNAVQGFIMPEDYSNEDAKKFGFTKVDKVVLKTGTAASTYMEKLNNGTATKEDEIYGLSVWHNEEVKDVHITYSYLGISFDRPVRIN